MVIERDELGFDAPAPLGHPARAGLPSNKTTGPEIGDQLPDFSLPNQNGEPIQFHQHRAGRKAVLVFYRSAVW